MVAPVNSTNGLNSLLRTQNTGSVSPPAANRSSALAATNKGANTAPSPALKNITLSSNKSPPTNLPRGSIVDKLV